MIPLAVPNLCGNEARYLQECIDTTFVSTVGEFVGRFETLVAAAVGSKGAVALSSGTCGLHMALRAVGVCRDDLVITPDFTFIASANAVAHCGAIPWLMDVDVDSWSLDAELLAKSLRTETEQRASGLFHRPSGRRVAAILPVYALGCPADMDSIVALAAEFGLPVVADAAAALGATYKGRPPGVMGANLSVFSFNGNKTVTAGGGGIVAGDDPALVAKVKHLSTTARKGEDYAHDEIGFNYRMTNLQAAVGVAQMEMLDQLVAAKHRIRASYDAAFQDLPGIRLFPDPEWAESACWFSGVVFDSPKPGLLEVTRRKLRHARIDARPFWQPMHRQLPFAYAPRALTGVSEFLKDAILTLPCSTGLSEIDQETVIQATFDILQKTLES
jgi:perosamine synthetase